ALVAGVAGGLGRRRGLRGRRGRLLLLQLPLPLLRAAPLLRPSPLRGPPALRGGPSPPLARPAHPLAPRGGARLLPRLRLARLALARRIAVLGGGQLSVDAAVGRPRLAACRESECDHQHGSRIHTVTEASG